MRCLALIIEDHEDFRVLLEDRLHRLDCEVIAASDSIEGLQLAKEKRPDLIILDRLLPKMNGDQVCANIRKDETIRAVPIVMFSVLDDMNDESAGKKIGADLYLRKRDNHRVFEQNIINLMGRMEHRRRDTPLVFMSYCKSDYRFASKLYQDLKALKDFDVWIDRFDILGGEVWEAKTQEALQRASAMLVILSQASLESEWVRREYQKFNQLKKFILPILRENIAKERIPLTLSNLQRIDFTEDLNYEPALQDVIRSLNVSLARR